MNQSKVSIFDFSGIYDYEGFYKEIKSPRFICLKEVSGTNCLCDDTAAEAIKATFDDQVLSDGALRFFDSGNYHYMSKLLADYVREPFNLIVYDHHPDMQPSSFGSILSCGSWVMDTLDTNPFVKNVVVVGAADTLIEKVDPSYLDRVTFYSPSDAMKKLQSGEDFFAKESELPVYLSIDKDVLSLEEIVTNWDQGEMYLKDLYNHIDMIYNFYKVIATDVCGECAPDQEGCDVAGAALLSSDINKGIFDIWHKNNH